VTIAVQPLGKDEYADVINEGTAPVDLSRSNLNAGDRGQDFVFPDGVVLQPRGRVRVYTYKANPGPGEFSFGSKKSIWNDQGDVPVLTDARGVVIAVAPFGTPVNPPPPPVITVTLNEAPVTAHDFGASKIGVAGNTVTFTIGNVGGSNLALTGDVTIAGADAASFSLQQQPAKTLPPRGHTTVTVEFRPDTKGPKRATLTIASNDRTRGSIAIELSGLGQAREAVLELGATLPATDGIYDFGAQIIGGAGRTETFSVKNTGDEDLVLTGKPPIQPDIADGSFTVQGPAETTVPPGGTTSFTVTFKPSGGRRAVSYTIPYGTDPARAQTLVVVGKGVGPEINLKEGASDMAHGVASRDFGALRPGQQSGAMTFTVENQGDATLQLTGNPPVCIVGPNAADFQVLSQPAASIDAGGASTFTVRFAPQSSGAKRAQLSIASTDLDENPYLIDLVGKAGIQVAGPPRHVAVTPRIGYVLRAGGTVWATNGVQIQGITDAVAIYASYHQGLHVVKADGSLWGDSGTRKILDGVVDVGLGKNHMVVLRDDGTVWARGSNHAGQVGTGPEREAGFREVSGLRDVVAVAASCDQSGALGPGGTVWVWGQNIQGLGPWGLQQLPGISGVIAFSMCDNVGSFHGSLICMAFEGGNVTWAGFRGGATPSFTSLMTLPGRPAGAVCSLDQTGSAMAFTTGGELWSTGINFAYRLGRGPFMQNLAPGPIPYLPPVSAVATNSVRVIALGKDGSVWEWGLLDPSKPPPHCYVQGPRRNPNF
jgi:hypothetical protein